MSLDDRFDQMLLVLGAIMLVVAVLNWANRAHGGFAKGMAGAIFISACWAMGILFILLKLRT